MRRYRSIGSVLRAECYCARNSLECSLITSACNITTPSLAISTRRSIPRSLDVSYLLRRCRTASSRPRWKNMPTTPHVKKVRKVPPIHGPIALFLKSCLFLKRTIQPLSPRPGTSPEHQQLSYSPMNSIRELAINQRAFRLASSLPTPRRRIAVAQ